MVHTSLRVGVLMVCLCWSPMALHATTITYSAFDLAQGRVTLPAPLLADVEGVPLKGTVDGEACSFTVLDGALSPEGESPCPTLWAQEELKDLDVKVHLPKPDARPRHRKHRDKAEAEVSLNLKPRQAATQGEASTLEVIDGVVNSQVFLGDGDRMTVYDPDTERWVLLFSESDGAVELPMDLQEHETLYAFTEKSGLQLGYYAWTLKLTDSASPTGPATSGGPAPLLNPGDPTTGFCPEARRRYRQLPSRNHVICVDAEEREFQVKHPPAGTILAPNTSIVLVVRLLKSQTLQIEIEGEIGAYIPGQRLPDKGPTRGGDGADDEPEYQVVERVFAPRTGGESGAGVVMTVTVLNDVGELGSTGQVLGGALFGQTRVELLADRTYSSALRVGVGGIFLGAVDREYEGELSPGATQGEIVTTGDQSYDMELVIGFAAFLEDGGRSYAQTSYTNFSPYIGLGALSFGGAENELEFLKSLHVGLEWEINPSFSIASTLVLRRVTRLAPGNEIGGPVVVGEDGTGNVPTVQRQALGLGVVLNVSPEFLRLGQGGLF